MVFSALFQFKKRVVLLAMTDGRDRTRYMNQYDHKYHIKEARNALNELEKLVDNFNKYTWEDSIREVEISMGMLKSYPPKSLEIENMKKRIRETENSLKKDRDALKKLQE